MSRKKIVLASLIGIVFFCLFFVRTYVSTPGFTTEEGYREFFKTTPSCVGIDLLLNREATYADAPGVNLCIGILSYPT